MAGGATETQRPPAQRGMYILPSLFTAGNIAIGYYIIVQSIRGATMGDNWAFDRAAIAIAVAILFDGLDGRIARMTNTSSAFGRELDSLADVITFASFGLSDHSCAVGPLRRGDLLSFPHLWSMPFSAVQHQREPAAAQSRPAGPQILCRNADSSGGGRYRRGHPF